MSVPTSETNINSPNSTTSSTKLAGPTLAVDPLKTFASVLSIGFSIHAQALNPTKLKQASPVGFTHS